MTTGGVLVLREVAAYKRNAGDPELADLLDAVADELAATVHQLATRLAQVIGRLDADALIDWPAEGWGEEGGMVPAPPSYGGTDD